MSTSPSADRLLDVFVARYPIEAAKALARVGPGEVVRLFGDLRGPQSAAVLRYLNPDQAIRILDALESARCAELLVALDPTEAAALIARLGPDQKREILSALPEDLARQVGEIMTYPPDTAGNLMDARATRLSEDSTVAATLEHIRQIKDRPITDIIVGDDEGRLVGMVPVLALVGAETEQSLGALMTRDVPSVHPMASREEVLELLAQHALSSLPVTDFEGRVVGVLRQAALLSAVQEEAAADLQQMVGAAREERALSGFGVAVRTRLPWLHVNLVTAFLASGVVAIFETTIARYTAVAVLLPIVAGQSGNTGAQALAVTMRGLALREIRPAQWLRVVRKEMMAAAINGLVIALVTGVGVLVWSRDAVLAAVIAIAMVVSMVIAAASGVGIPAALKALRRDPATASSIILTTVTDIVGFFTFLGLATLALQLMAK